MNLFQSHVCDGLVLPVLPGPWDEWAAFGNLTPDSSTLKEVAELLRSCETDYLKPVCCAPVITGKQRTTLQQSVALCYADAFAIRVNGKATLPQVTVKQALQNSKTEEIQIQAEPATLQLVKSNKRRRNQHNQEELRGQKTTESVEDAIREFVMKAEAEAGDGDGHNHDQSKREDFQSLLQGRDVQLLGSEIQRCQPAIKQLPADLLSTCLARLHIILLRGEDIKIRSWDEGDSEEAAVVLESLDACVAALMIMNADGVPAQVMSEELIMSIFAIAKKQLLLNVFAHTDPCTAVTDKKNAYTKKAQNFRTTPRHQQLISRIQCILSSLATLLGGVHIEEAHVMPLIRIAAEALTTPDMEALQTAASEFIVATFKQYAQQRDIVLDDLLTAVLPNIPPAKERGKKAAMKSKSATQPLISLATRMIQDSSALPVIGTPPSQWEKSLFPAQHWTDHFWKICINRCASAKAAKSDSQSDMRTVLDRMVTDLLAMYCKPEFPAAVLMLNRLCCLLGGGLGLSSSESGLKQVSVDTLNTIGSQFFCDARRAEEEMETAAGNAGYPDCSARSGQLLQYLASCSHTEGDIFASAQSFRLYQLFLDSIDRRDSTADDQAVANEAALDQMWQMKLLCEENSGQALSAVSAELLAKVEALQHLARLRMQILKWLHMCMESKDSGPAVRAKIVKAVSAFIQADARLLARDQIASCFRIALEDESPSVRLESLNLLGIHISSSHDLSDIYYNIIAMSTGDKSVGVRRASMRIILEKCIMQPGFHKSAEACCLVLQQACEDEESIQDLVARYFHMLLFSNPAGSDENKGADLRAAQLAGIVEFINSTWEQSNVRQMLTPLDPSHPLVWVLSRALGIMKLEEGLQVGRELAAALLDGIISSQETSEAPGLPQQRFPYLLALHALALSNVQLCIPAENPIRFVACLAPYLKVDWANQSGQRKSEREVQYEAEQLVCVLAVSSAVLQQVDSITSSLARDLEVDLMKLIQMHTFQSVVAAACQTVCHLHLIVPNVGMLMTKLASRYMELITECCQQGYPQNSCKFSKRYLCVLGQILRHGSQIVEAKSLDPEFQRGPLTTELCFNMVVSICSAKEASITLREQSLRTMGMIAIARPDLLLSEQSRDLLTAALQASSDFRLTRAALSLLLDLLKYEEHSVLAGHSKAAAKSAQQGKGKKRLPQEISAQNGEKDALSAGNGVVRENEQHVLRLMTCVEIECASQLPAPESLAGMIRHGAVQVIEIVERNGILPPWRFVPYLIAATTDARESSTAELSLQVLKRIAAKHFDIILQSLGTGLELAASFQRRLSSMQKADVSTWTAVPQSAVLGLQTVYQEVLQSSKQSKQGMQAMITAISKRLESACSVVSTADVGLEVLLVCASLAAQLPWKRADEILVLLAGLTHIAVHAGDGVLRSLKESAAAIQHRQQAARAGFALAAVVVVVEYLMAKYSLSPSRIAAFQDPEKRKAEERAVFQQQPLEFQFRLSMAGFQSQPAGEQYTGLKALLNHFYAHSSYLLAQRTNELPEAGSPSGAVTPSWAQQAVGKRRKSVGQSGAAGHEKQLGRKSVGRRPGQRGRPKKPVHGGSEDESDDFP